MKRRMLSLVLAVVVVLSLGAIAAPVSADYDVSKKTSGPAFYTAIKTYDIRYVNDTGDDGKNGETKPDAWRTITHAAEELPYGGANPDMIIVMEGEYGGPAPNDIEKIVIDEPVVVVSEEGWDDTVVDVTGQGADVPPQIILVNSSDVIIDGLMLLGNAGTNPGTYAGVLAMPDPLHSSEIEVEHQIKYYLQNVQVLNCYIKIVDEAGNAVCGVEMKQVKQPIIDNSQILVGTEADLTCPISVVATMDFFEGHIGIALDDCFNSVVTNNDIDVKDKCKATGIAMKDCPKSVVGGQGNGNDIDVHAALDATAYGIKVDDSDLIQILYNAVCVFADSTVSSRAYGIKVEDSDRAVVTGNNPVDVSIELDNADPGKGVLLGRGIEVEDSDEVRVELNNITMHGEANFDLGTMGLDLGALDEDLLDELEDIAEMLLETLGKQDLHDFKLGTVKGIYMDNCNGGSKVLGNIIDALLEIEGSTSNQVDTRGGGGYTAGISCYKSSGITVGQNTVDKAETLLGSPDELNINVGQECRDKPPAYLSVAHGIVLQRCDDSVAEENTSIACADVTGTLTDVGDRLHDASETESALSLLSSDVLDALFESAYETEGAAVDILGGGGHHHNWPGDILAVALGSGILALKSDDVSILDNPLVSGTGSVDISLVAEEGQSAVKAEGGGMGFGVGIGVVDGDDPTVSGNGQVGDFVVTNGEPEGVYGTGSANVTVTCGTEAKPIKDDSTEVDGEAAAVGVGIMLVEDSHEIDSAYYEGGYDGPGAVVNNNVASGSANACPVTVQSATEDTGHRAYATAEATSIAVAMGISADNYDCILIQGNEADADANACLETGAYGEDTFCPDSEGSAAAIAGGILTTRCMAPDIIDNQALGTATASSDTWADEVEVEATDSEAEGGSLAFGFGIIDFEGPHGTIQGNSVATGLADAYCNVDATSDVPLNEADAEGAVCAIGMGIGVMESPCTDVIRCNTAAGEGTARISVEATADFDYAEYCGFAGDYDIVLKLMHQRCHGYTEQDVDAEGHPWWRHGVVNYNSMVDSTPINIDPSELPIFEDDAGLLNIHPMTWCSLDATLNWWNHPTGPSGNGPGNGEPVKWCGQSVNFTPWLYVVHTEVLSEQIGKFGFFFKMAKGLNTLSTPIALEQNIDMDPDLVGVQASRTWGDIAHNSGLDLPLKVKYVDKWVPGSGWQTVLPTDTLDPLNAWYIYLFGPGEDVILFVNSSAGHPYAMPTRGLIAGWSLIGPNPLFSQPGMHVKPALSSIEMTPASLPGYVQVISPMVNGQPSWIFVPSMPGPGDWMMSGKGYWVWMENSDILVGFGFSPLPAGP